MIFFRVTRPTVFCICFFFKYLVDTCPFMGPLIPLFWISGDVSSGFQSQSGQHYLNLTEVYVVYIQ